MFPHRSRALAATLLFTAAIATAGCAQSTTGFTDGGSVGETGGGGASDGGTGPGASGPGAAGPGGSGGIGGSGGSGGDMGGMGGIGGNGGGMGGMGGMMAVEGTTCMDAADLTGGAVTLMGSFTDAITGAGSCDPNATNVAWYSYTAPQDGLYDLSFVNSPSIPAFSRVAIFEGSSCGPLGPEVACELASGPQLDALVLLHENVTYTVMFYTDGAAYPMENPVASITPTAYGPGSVCLLAEDLTNEAFPYTLSGTFNEDPPDLQPTCDTGVTNVAWFKYTAPSTDTFLINAANATTTNAYSRVAVFLSGDCSPFGAQVSCNTFSGKSVTGQADMVSGQEYLIAFYTDGDSYTMIDPTLDISVKPPPPPGGLCPLALDVTGALPFQQVGVFNEDPTNATPTCDTTPTNTAWFTFTPATSDWYDISAVNNTATAAGSRLAIFDGTTCTPPGAQLFCGTSTTPSFTTANSVFLTGGNTYTILFYTNGDTYTMVDPQIDITIGGPPPEGSTCVAPFDVTGQTFPVQQLGDFTDDPTNITPTCDTTPTNAVWFSYQPAVSDWYTMNFANNTTDNSYSRVAIFEGSTCAPTGPQIYCQQTSSLTHTVDAIFLDSSITYTMVFYTDGDSYAMEDPELDITVAPDGIACGTAADVSSQAFPFTLTGTFPIDPAVAGSCDTTPNNAVWYDFTPTVTQAYTITGVNATATNAFSRIAIFDGATCNPLGTELGCVTNASKTASLTNITLTAGMPYRIVFYTDGDIYTMVNPTLTITP